jgi:hypothetical protein
VITPRSDSILRVAGLGLLVAVVSGCGGGHAGRPTAPSPAPVPAGLTTTVGSEFRHDCKRAASGYRYTLYCPTVVPSGEIKLGFTPGPVQRNDPPRKRSLAYQLDLISPALQELNGRRMNANGGHWTIMGGRASEIPDFVHPPSTDTPTRTARRRLGAGVVATIALVPAYQAGGGYYGGHVVVIWRYRGLEYQLSAHDYANRDRALAMAESMLREQRSCPRPTAAPPCSMVFEGLG